MNRKQKIIISVTGIFLVLLILVGLTYAYFLTRINGNPNNTSISLTTANLQLDWIDGTDKIIDSTDVIVPGQFESSITFSVKNNGNATVKDYGVILTDLRIKWASTVEGTNQVQNVDTYLEHSDTMKLTVCKLSNGECIETKYDGSLPTTNEILFTSNITSGETQEYKATLNYIDEGNQSADMNKTITARLDIIDTKNTAVLAGTVDNYTPGDIVQSNSTPRISTIDKNGNYKIVGLEPGNHTVSVKDKDSASQGSKSITVEKDTKVIELNIDRSSSEYTLNGSVSNPYSEGTLAYEIINNAQQKKNGTQLVVTPPTKVAEEISTDNWNLGVEETTYYDAEYVVHYAASEEALLRCYQGYEDEETGEWKEDCSGVKDYESCTSEVEKKYVYYKYMTVYVDRCENGKIVNGTAKYEKVLSTTLDDLGTSYYYRGNVEDNYVNFAGMCWRIVRIAGDGSTKLILEDQYTTCDDTETETTSAVYTGNWNIGTGDYGYDSSSKSTSGSTLYKMNYLNPVTNNTSSMVKAFYDFQITKLADYTGKLKSGDWCLGEKAYTSSGSSGSYTYTLLEDTSSNYLSKTSFYYDADTRLISGNANGYQPTLKCNGTILNEFADVSGVSSKAPMYVSAITADEIVYAGGSRNVMNYNYYLINNYQKSKYKSFWSLSPDVFNGTHDFAFNVSNGGSLSYDSVSYNYSDRAFRPSVSLASSAVISSGEGTLEKPYVIG